MEAEDEANFDTPFGSRLDNDLLKFLLGYSHEFRGGKHWNRPEYIDECLQALGPTICFLVTVLHKHDPKAKRAMIRHVTDTMIETVDGLPTLAVVQ